MSKQTLVLDSSQISTFLECPQLWYYQYFERLSYEHTHEKEAMNAGTYGHQLLDIYYRARVTGKTLDDAAALAFDFNIDTEYKCKCGHLKSEHTRDLALLKNQSTNACGRCNQHEICWTFDPVPFTLSQDLRIAVKTRLREYFFTYAQNDFQPYSKDSVEVGFSEPIYEDKDNLFVLEGRIDLIGTLQGLPTIVDHKFQMRKRELYKKAVQFRNYNLVCPSINMLIINYIRLTKGVTKGETLVRDIVSFNSRERDWWKQELINIFHRVKKTLASTPEKNYSMCAGKYGYQCIYTPLCEEMAQDLVQLKKQQMFVVDKNPWRPW